MQTRLTTENITGGMTDGPRLHSVSVSRELMNYTFSFYKNLDYKNSNGPKIKNILRTYEGFKSSEKFFVKGNT